MDRSSLPRTTLNNGSFGKKAGELWFYLSRPIEGFDKRLPLFRRSDKLALVGENVFCLQTSAIQDEVREAGAGCLGTGANQSFLTRSGAEIDASGPESLGTPGCHGSG
ncbi:MAG: hypothetical protein WAR24_05505, partial [Candidatus Acidiferrales bacterium]